MINNSHVSLIADKIRAKLPPITYPECYDYILNLPEEKYPKYLKLVYFRECRRILHYDNPQYLSEKIQWLKLFDATKEKTEMTDKILVRNYVAEKIGNEYLRELYEYKQHFRDINFQDLPNNFVLKCNHGCKFHYFIKDKAKLLEVPALVTALEKKFESWLNTKYIAVGFLELQYKNIQPMIFAEENLQTENNLLDEYQIYCFHGQPKLIEKLIFALNNYRVLWDENLNPSPILFNNKKNVVENATKEVYEMIELAKILSKDINFVRVDFIVKNGKIYFNEMTFSPFSGFLPFKRNDDLLLGSYLHLNKGIN